MLSFCHLIVVLQVNTKNFLSFRQENCFCRLQQCFSVLSQFLITSIFSHCHSFGPSLVYFSLPRSFGPTGHRPTITSVCHHWTLTPAETAVQSTAVFLSSWLPVTFVLVFCSKVFQASFCVRENVNRAPCPDESHQPLKLMVLGTGSNWMMSPPEVVALFQDFDLYPWL